MTWYPQLGQQLHLLNTPTFLERLGLLTQELDIKPEIEIFDAGMLGNVDYYLKKGVLKAPLHYQLVLDVPGGMPGNIDSINHLVSKLPEGSTWSITGIGKAHMPCMLAVWPPAATTCASVWRTTCL